jgi:hypothetical protein
MPTASKRGRLQSLICWVFRGVEHPDRTKASSHHGRHSVGARYGIMRYRAWRRPRAAREHPAPSCARRSPLRPSGRRSADSKQGSGCGAAPPPAASRCGPCALGLDDADNSLGTVDVADPQPDHLASPETAAIGQCEHHPQLQCLCRGEEALDLIRAHHRRDLARLADLIELGRNVAPAQRHPQQELHTRHDAIAIADGEPAPGQIQLEATDGIGAGSLRRASEKSGKPLAAADIMPLRLWPQLRAVMPSIMRWRSWRANCDLLYHHPHRQAQRHRARSLFARSLHPHRRAPDQSDRRTAALEYGAIRDAGSSLSRSTPEAGSLHRSLAAHKLGPHILTCYRDMVDAVRQRDASKTLQ